ncbi:DNA translocase SftA [compost metagenome]
MFLTLTGAAMIATSVIGIHRNMPNTQLKTLLRKYFESNKLEGVKVRNIYRRDDHTFVADIGLPMHITAAELQSHMPGIEQVTSTFAKFKYKGGPSCYIEFGYSDFKDRMPFQSRSYVEPLTIPLYTPFGKKVIDFRQETSCHMLIGGATRMGKTAFIRLLAVLLIHSTQGNVVVKMLDNKINDLYMFRKVRQVEIGETEEDAIAILTEALRESERRKALLRAHDDCIDLAEYRKKYPDADPIPPYFVIIDEYGRFADNDLIQKAVERLVETAGYLDMHVVIASQRPDAQTVLKARIKANLTTRVCFTTMDEMNSKVVLDIPDAARLRKVQGRAILLDGFPEVVQVPFLSTIAATELLEPYKEVNYHDDSAGRTDSSDGEPLQSFKPQAIGADRIPEPKKRNGNRKQSAKKAGS